MARVLVNTVRIIPGLIPIDAAEVATAIDAAQGMRVLPHASAHAVTAKAPQNSGNPRGAYGAAGPAGSKPSEPDYVSAQVPATTGVRYLVVPSSFVQSDGSIWLDFEAAHTGTIAAIEIP